MGTDFCVPPSGWCMTNTAYPLSTIFKLKMRNCDLHAKQNVVKNRYTLN